MVVVRPLTEEGGTSGGGLTLWVPTWWVAEGDLVEGTFRQGERFWTPVGEEVRLVSESSGKERGLGQVIYSVAPALGYRRALRLGEDPEAFRYLTLAKPLDSLYGPQEVWEKRSGLEALVPWQWFFRALEELMGLGFTAVEGYKALDFLGEPAVGLAKINPFLLCQAEGVEYGALVGRFRREDEVGWTLQRLKEEYRRRGWTLFTPNEIAPKLDTKTAQSLAEAAHGQIFFAEGYLGLAQHVDWEMEIWDNFLGRSALPPIPPPPDLGEDQAKVVELLPRRVGLLTGGPGTGKTHTLARLVGALTLRGVHVRLMAPTGKAARRMSSLSGTEASTLHRALRIRPHEGFRQYAVLPRGLTVLDEASMLSLEDAVALMRALPEGASLLMVGDVDQLPPVQPGQPFADLLARGGGVRLERVRRQKEGASLLDVARATLAGIPWREVVSRSTDFLYVQVRSPEEAKAWVRRIYGEYLGMGLSTGEVQVLSATNVGPLGTRVLNGVVRGVLPPRGPSWRKDPEVVLGDGHLARPGDKLIFLDNRPTLGVANGTMGILEAVQDEVMYVRTDEGMVEIPKALGYMAALGYAITVHRSQGSEWPVVILVVSESSLLTRRLVYTALTRAKEQIVVVSLPDLMALPLREDPPRRTWLNTLAL